MKAADAARHFASAQLPLLDEMQDGPRAAPQVRISAKARRLSIRIYPDARVEVVVPPRARPRDIERFIAAHREWIEAKRTHALRHRPAPEAFPPAVIELRLTGERFRILQAAGKGPTKASSLGEPGARERILRLTGESQGPGMRHALREWLTAMARARLTPRLERIAAAAGVRFARISVRRQRSRWGSCSVRGTISLNCCLLFQRPEVVDYLIIHELMHVQHMNHSPRFWQAVARHCPAWRQLDRELVQGWRQVPGWVFSDE
jgi:predicted metal-dependent hydrolase